MYTRSDFSRRRASVPENYGGTAFSEESEAFTPPPTETDTTSLEASCKENGRPIPIKDSFFGLDSEDLLLLGLIFLLAQSDKANDIIPLLLILLFC